MPEHLVKCVYTKLVVKKSKMIHYLLPEQIAKKSRERGCRLTIKEVAEETGVSANTLSRMINVPGYSCSISVIDDLCRYFGCKVEDLLTYTEN